MNKKAFAMVLCVGIVVIFTVCLFRYIIPNEGNRASINISSTLTKAIDIADLSTAEFKYRGIAEIYDDEAKTNVRCRICYNAVVKAGINMKDVQFFDISTDKKTVKAVLPDIDIKVNIIDEKSMAVLPSNADVDVNVMLKASKEDVEKEAKESEELIKAARENLEATIKGLLLPILNSEGYSIEFA